jgi:hypothetical protein
MGLGSRALFGQRVRDTSTIDETSSLARVSLTSHALPMNTSALDSNRVAVAAARRAIGWGDCRYQLRFCLGPTRRDHHQRGAAADRFGLTLRRQRPAVARRCLRAVVRRIVADRRAPGRSARSASGLSRRVGGLCTRVDRVRVRSQRIRADRGARASRTRRGGDAAQLARLAQSRNPARPSPACARDRYLDGVGQHYDRGRSDRGRFVTSRGRLAQHCTCSACTATIRCAAISPICR